MQAKYDITHKNVIKYYFILACIFSIVQSVGAQEQSPSASDYARLYVGAVEPQYESWLWNDVPYYQDDANTFNGRISYYGVVYDNVQLRFDQLKQQVVVLSPVGKVYCLPEQAHVDWFEMDGHRYVHDPEDSTRYSYLLCDGSRNGVCLYHHVWKVYDGERVFGRNTYKKVLSSKDHYTLVSTFL